MQGLSLSFPSTRRASAPLGVQHIPGLVRIGMEIVQVNVVQLTFFVLCQSFILLFSPPLPGFGTGIPQRAAQAIRAAPIVGRVEKDPPASGNTQRPFQTATRPAAPPQSCCNDKPALFLILRFPLFLFLPVSKKRRQEGGVALDFLGVRS